MENGQIDCKIESLPLVTLIQTNKVSPDKRCPFPGKFPVVVDTYKAGGQYDCYTWSYNTYKWPNIHG